MLFRSESAAREAAAGFGDDTLIVEKLVSGARHVEVQLLADSHGNRLYVGDRDCSLQRRHQKVVEEAPAPGLPHTLRMAMGEAGDACGLIQGELPPSSVSDHRGSRISLRACRTSSSHGRNWNTASFSSSCFKAG